MTGRVDAMRTPAILIDRFYVTINPGIVRIACGEFADEPIFRTAIAMSIENWQLLKTLVDGLIEPEVLQ